MSQFDIVIKEFQQRRLEKEIVSQQVKHERLQQLRELAQVADIEMRQRKRKQRNYQNQSF
ncbi:MAG: hypothetical protein CVV27_14195 [Candidatus Melainabacteria bacterium HGW-Melainabacteria-1]|nr:MAG: hypothetical protein CVV27_14195 [Candidatus Melainabacteria bacterium HGW-Melainabacteria-1]